MMDAIEKALKELGVPLSRYHSERRVIISAVIRPCSPTQPAGRLRQHMEYGEIESVLQGIKFLAKDDRVIG